MARKVKRVGGGRAGGLQKRSVRNQNFFLIAARVSTFHKFIPTILHSFPRTRHSSMSVTLHTDLGDIKVEVNCNDVKKAAYNFLALCASGYYDNTLIHRNIKGFMVQMGDPTGTGKGGT